MKNKLILVSLTLLCAATAYGMEAPNKKENKERRQYRQQVVCASYVINNMNPEQKNAQKKVTAARAVLNRVGKQTEKDFPKLSEKCNTNKGKADELLKKLNNK